PGTSPSALRHVIRYFVPWHDTVYPRDPWSEGFSSGTAISTGITLARRALERDGVRGEVVLISDLADFRDDHPALARSLIALAADPVWFRSAALPGGPGDEVGLYHRIFGRQIGSTPEREAASAFPPRSGTSPAFPVGLVALTGLAAAFLVAHELL